MLNSIANVFQRMDGLLSSMTLDQFESTARPRMIGTLNLHEALEDSPLDFFQIWTSCTVMFGTATQSNYHLPMLSWMHSPITHTT